MSKALSDVALIDLVPASIKRDQAVETAASVIDPYLREITRVSGVPSIYANLDGLTSAQLDHLAYSWDVTVWRDSWSEAMKRSVIRGIVSQKVRMGTLHAIKEVLASFGSAASVTEWWQKTPKGTPHTFEIIVTVSATDGVVSTEAQEDVQLLIDMAKPVRSHYTFTLSLKKEGTLTIAPAIRTACYARLTSGRKPIRILIRIFPAMRPVVVATLEDRG